MARRRGLPQPWAKATQDEFIAIETFASEQAAYDWLKKEAVARQFRNIQITTRVVAY